MELIAFISLFVTTCAGRGREFNFFGVLVAVMIVSFRSILFINVFLTIKVSPWAIIISILIKIIIKKNLQYIKILSKFSYLELI